MRPLIGTKFESTSHRFMLPEVQLRTLSRRKFKEQPPELLQLLALHLRATSSTLISSKSDLARFITSVAKEVVELEANNVVSVVVPRSARGNGKLPKKACLPLMMRHPFHPEFRRETNVPIKAILDSNFFTDSC